MAEFGMADAEVDPKLSVSIKRVAPSGKIENGIKVADGYDRNKIELMVSDAVRMFDVLEQQLERFREPAGGGV